MPTNNKNRTEFNKTACIMKKNLLYVRLQFTRGTYFKNWFPIRVVKNIISFFIGHTKKSIAAVTRKKTLSQTTNRSIVNNNRIIIVAQTCRLLLLEATVKTRAHFILSLIYYETNAFRMENVIDTLTNRGRNHRFQIRGREPTVPEQHGSLARNLHANLARSLDGHICRYRDP